MKKLIKPVLMLFAVLMISSCSILKKKKEIHTESSTVIKQGSQSSTAAVDTSKKTTDEHWRIYIPGAQLKAQVKENAFEPVFSDDFSDATDEQQSAMAAMQGAFADFTEQNKASGNAQNYTDGILIDLKRKIAEQTGKASTEQKQDSLKYDKKEETDIKEKEKKESPDIYFLILCGVLVSVVINKIGK